MEREQVIRSARWNPVFSGTRVPVQTLIDYLKAGDSLDDFLDGFPSAGPGGLADRSELGEELPAGRERGPPSPTSSRSDLGAGGAGRRTARVARAQPRSAGDNGPKHEHQQNCECSESSCSAKSNRLRDVEPARGSCGRVRQEADRLCTVSKVSSSMIPRPSHGRAGRGEQKRYNTTNFRTREPVWI